MEKLGSWLIMGANAGRGGPFVGMMAGWEGRDVAPRHGTWATRQGLQIGYGPVLIGPQETVNVL